MKTLILTDEQFRVLSMVVQDAHSAPDVLRWNEDETTGEAERNNDVLQKLLAEHFCSDSPYER